MLETKLVARLATIAEAYPLEAPENVTFPAIVYNRVTSHNTRNLDGSDGTATMTLQIDLYCRSYGESKRLSRQMVTLLEDWSEDGIQMAMVDDVTESIDKTTEARLFRQMLRVTVFGSPD